jgi:hypothetical protein
MKGLTITILLSMILAATGFARIGEDEKQIEARYGKAGKDLGNHGNVHEVGYISTGFAIVVDYVNGVSQREGFTKPDTAQLTPENIQQILNMSAAEGTKWEELPTKTGDITWSRSDNKAIAILPAQGNFLFVQDVGFVQPK